MKQFRSSTDLRDRYEAHHRVKITDASIEAAEKCRIGIFPTGSFRIKRLT